MSTEQESTCPEVANEESKEEKEPADIPSTTGSKLFEELDEEVSNTDPPDTTPDLGEVTGQDEVSNLWDDLMKGTDVDPTTAVDDQDNGSTFNFDNDFDAMNAFQTPVTDDFVEHNKEAETLDDTGTNGVARARPRPSASGGAKATNPFNIALKEVATKWEQNNDADEGEASPLQISTAANPFAANDSNADVENMFKDEDAGAGEAFNPFATIRDDENDGFDLFQTIHDDVPEDGGEVNDGDQEISFFQDNPFGEPASEQNDENFANFGEATLGEPEKPTESFEDSMDEDDQEDLEPLPPFHPKWEFGDGWNLLLRQPFKKKLTQNRFWKPAYVRIVMVNDIPMIRIFPNDKDQECLYELTLQITNNICHLGLQQLDQFGKCHTVKIQQINYKETVGVKTDRIAPTISDLTRVRDLKGLKDLMHKPKATMILDHAANSLEVLKFGTLNYEDIKSFTHAVEDLLFWQKAIRGKSASYTKDEVTVDVQDEYYAEIDKEGHITHHKARVRFFCLAFLSESPIIEVGVNDKRRRGKEIVGRQDIIPIKTEEWIKIEDYELHSTIDKEEFEKSKVLKFNPLDACRYELLRFRVRPRLNVELPLQIRVQTSIVERHIEVRVEVMVTGYYSNSRRAAQTPCEEIQIRFPIPEDWVYIFRVEKRFKYGAVHSSKRKAGKIKGLERLTAFAQGILPPSLIEVSTGLAKYEQAFHAVVWRIDQLPERNEGAYKTHLMAINLDLAPHDKMPEELDKYVYVEYAMTNSTVSRAQVRSIAIHSGADEPPDRWVRHLAKYEYKIEMEFTDKVKPQSEDILAPLKPAPQPEEIDSNAPKAAPEDDSENSSSDSD